MLFHVVNDRYLSGRSMIFTTNKKLTDWGAVLHDHDLAAAIVDRLLERGRIIALDGPSTRSQNLALDEEIDPMVPHRPDRISGKHRTESREPTGTSTWPNHRTQGSGEPTSRPPSPITMAPWPRVRPDEQVPVDILCPTMEADEHRDVDVTYDK
jgi:hypothetical protein